jgi:hypothetical protein
MTFIIVKVLKINQNIDKKRIVWFSFPVDSGAPTTGDCKDGGANAIDPLEVLMSDFTKWEQNSVKTNVVIPVVFLVVALILIVGLFVLKPKPPEVEKKDAASALEAETAFEQEDIDWEKF